MRAGDDVEDPGGVMFDELMDKSGVIVLAILA